MRVLGEKAQAPATWPKQNIRALTAVICSRYEPFFGAKLLPSHPGVLGKTAPATFFHLDITHADVAGISDDHGVVDCLSLIGEVVHVGVGQGSDLLVSAHRMRIVSTALSLRGSERQGTDNATQHLRGIPPTQFLESVIRTCVDLMPCSEVEFDQGASFAITTSHSP